MPPLNGRKCTVPAGARAGARARAPRESTAPENAIGAASMAPVADEQDQEALIERLRVIEEQPLDARAEAYEGVVAELRAALESADER